PPSGTFTALAAGGATMCSVRTSGTVVCWGYNENRQATAPIGRFAQLSIGVLHTCGLATDGSIACWGDLALAESSHPNLAPVANAGGPYSANEGATLSFSASASFDPDGDPLRYDWNFGVGTTLYDAGVAPSHTFA